jgi:hypothetical protein
VTALPDPPNVDGITWRRATPEDADADLDSLSAMAVFASSGIEYATLEVDTENPTGAHGLYTGLGFERVRGYVDYTKVVLP